MSLLLEELFKIVKFIGLKLRMIKLKESVDKKKKL